MVNSAPAVKFGIAFNEASGPCLTRADGNDAELREAAIEIASSVGAGHFFAVVMRHVFPIHALKAIQAAPEVCNIFCATANPVEVIVAETGQGRGVLGVVDGASPKGVESEQNARERHDFLRKIGYKK
jgi:adenosine/AMP kinase